MKCKIQKMKVKLHQVSQTGLGSTTQKTDQCFKLNLPQIHAHLILSGATSRAVPFVHEDKKLNKFQTLEATTFCLMDFFKIIKKLCMNFFC